MVVEEFMKFGADLRFHHHRVQISESGLEHFIDGELRAVAPPENVEGYVGMFQELAKIGGGDAAI